MAPFFVRWINGRWREWDEAHGHKRGTPHTEADHRDFDTWLAEKVEWARANSVMAYLEAALAKVDSQSVREWAQTPHNLSPWLKMAERALAKGTDVHVFAAYIVAQAIGL
jgi:hypothetical protein